MFKERLIFSRYYSFHFLVKGVNNKNRQERYKNAALKKVYMKTRMYERMYTLKRPFSLVHFLRFKSTLSRLQSVRTF